LAVLRRVTESTPRPIRELNPEVPETLEAIIERLHAKAPAERYATASDVAKDLARCLSAMQLGQSSAIALPVRPGTGVPLRDHAPGRGLRAAVLFIGAVLAACLMAGALPVWWFGRPGTAGEAPTLTPAASKAAAELAVIRGGEPMMHPHGGNTNSGVLALAGSRDGKYLASSSGVYDEDMATFTAWALKLWEPASGRLVRDFTSLDQPVRGIAFSPEGERLAIACQDGTVRVLDVSTGHERLKLAAHAEPVRTVAWAPDGLSIASAGQDTKVCVWNAATAEKTCTFAGHAGHVLHVAFSPESKRVVSTAIGSDNTARVWDAATGHELARYRGVDAPLRASVFSHDGGSVFTVGQDPHCHVWDATNGRRWYSFKDQPHDDWIIGVGTFSIHPFCKG
jgi:hypothetical protein